MVSHHARFVVSGLVLAGLGLVVAGCGSSSNAATASPTPTSAFAAYTACLSRNGVTLPTAGANGRTPGTRPSGRPTARPSGQPGRTGGPGNGGSGFGGGGFGGFGGAGFGNQPPAGVDAATWQKAQAACASVRPTAGPNGGGAGPGRSGGGGNSALTAYRNCLSEHGVTPSANPVQLNTADPNVSAAMTACAALRPTGRPTPTPTAAG